MDLNHVGIGVLDMFLYYKVPIKRNSNFDLNVTHAFLRFFTSFLAEAHLSHGNRRLLILVLVLLFSRIFHLGIFHMHVLVQIIDYSVNVLILKRRLIVH